jgi:hypothetical protein
MANIFDVHGDVSLGSTTSTDWSRVETTLSGSTAAAMQRLRDRNPHPQIIPMPEPAMSNQDIAKFRGELLLKLLEIESTRCNAKTEEDERTESLAQVLEGGDHIVSRIQAGMEKYMSLLGIHEEGPQVLSIGEMQRESVFREPNSSLAERRVRMTPREEDVWLSICRAFSHMNLPVDRAILMDANVNAGGRSSPEDQVTFTFRVNR